MKNMHHSHSPRSVRAFLPRRGVSFLVIAALCAGGSLPATAQAQADPVPDPTAPSTRRNTPEIPRKDRVFLNKAHVSGQKEIALARVALESANPEIQAFARQLIADHEAMAQELVTLANKRGVVLTRSDDRAERKLRKKSGKDLDEAFIEEVKDEHDDAVELFEDAVEDSRDAEIRDFAQRHLSALRAHQSKAAQLERLID